MGYVKNIGYVLLFGLVAMSFSQCSSAQKFQKDVPFEIGEVYYQNWVSGVKEGGSGTNIYIQIISNTKQIELDSIYFQGKVAKLELTNNILAIGRFSSNGKYKKDIVMSSDPSAEYGNKVPEFNKKTRFNLQGNQCVISYKVGNKIKYFKIDNIRKKALLAYPNSPNNKE